MKPVEKRRVRKGADEIRGNRSDVPLDFGHMCVMARETVLYQRGTFCVREYRMPTDHDEGRWRYPPPPIFVRDGGKPWGKPRNTMREEGAVPGLGWDSG